MKRARFWMSLMILTPNIVHWVDERVHGKIVRRRELRNVAKHDGLKGKESGAATRQRSHDGEIVESMKNYLANEVVKLIRRMYQGN